MEKLSELTKAQQSLLRRASELEKQRAYRDHMIREARTNGHTWQAIQDATGLTAHAVALALKRSP